ncbi:type II toxin-antitoxin system VapC family toxin [Ferrovibrio sp.]|uniref:type II toxin-antitoxin system VapC family toxin n=1 Tax=Ferrovibrio sp. TaxID=1917215 RepID=UPI001B5C7A64|nr:type II toxin-antitoxin system VapC family toxin [Ferrovibrio sp.]MBP7065830.1 type II toxin-antitoxin system VapC family toxin [Ferrovibrio sp.]
MNQFLLDTHALIWWLSPAERLSQTARTIIENKDNTIFVSSVSGWEMTIKRRAGKLAIPAVLRVLDNYQTMLDDNGFIALPIEIEDGLLAGNLDIPHRDPFDRMLFAQALRRDLGLVSIDGIADQAGCRRIW